MATEKLQQGANDKGSKDGVVAQSSNTSVKNPTKEQADKAQTQSGVPEDKRKEESGVPQKETTGDIHDAQKKKSKGPKLSKAQREEARQGRIQGWRTDNFRFREDEQGNLFIAQSEWIGPETLVVSSANLKELVSALKKVSSDLDDDGDGVEDLSDPTAAGYDPTNVPEDPQTTPQGK